MRQSKRVRQADGIVETPAVRPGGKAGIAGVEGEFPLTGKVESVGRERGGDEQRKDGEAGDHEQRGWMA